MSNALTKYVLLTANAIRIATKLVKSVETCYMKLEYFQRMNEIYFSKYMFWFILAIYLPFTSISVNGIARTKIIKKVGW